MILDSFVFDFLRATELAAIEASKFIGRMNSEMADKVAVDAMRKALNDIKIDGKVVIGEGELDDAPMLFIGEKVGKGGIRIGRSKLDIAVDPVEGTKLVAKNKGNAFSVLAIANKGSLLHAPDCYMNKIVVGPDAKGAKINLNASVVENLSEIARAKKTGVSDLTICVLDRPRHTNLIEEIRKTGAKISLIDDGDILGAISTCLPNKKIDALMGIGGAPEGVVSAAAIKCYGGNMQAQLILDTPALKERAGKMKIKDFNKIYTLEEMAKGEVAFIATGITDGYFLKGVRGPVTHSIILTMNYKKYIETEHG